MNKHLIFAAVAGAALTATPALADRGGHGHGHGNDNREWNDRGDNINYGYHHGSYRNCPPGLARKHNGCMAPGQYKKYRWSRGERLPRGYNSYTAYSRIPYSYRQRYDLDPNNRYIYQNGVVYQVDPRTQIIQQILSGLVR